MKTQFNNYSLNCAAVDRAGINKRRYQANERKKKAGKGFGEVLRRVMGR